MFDSLFFEPIKSYFIYLMGPASQRILSQEKFISLREKEVTEEESNKNKIETGWYSKDDMVKVLHWSASLCSCIYANISEQSAFKQVKKFPWIYTQRF